MFQILKPEHDQYREEEKKNPLIEQMEANLLFSVGKGHKSDGFKQLHLKYGTM